MGRTSLVQRGQANGDQPSISSELSFPSLIQVEGADSGESGIIESLWSFPGTAYVFWSWEFKNLVSGIPSGAVVKNLSASAGETGATPGQEDPLEEEMAALSSILAWDIPWTEEPGELQSMGPQRVGCS